MLEFVKIFSQIMSGLGPAACWLAHKRIESWSRMAKERVGAVRKVTLDRNSEDAPTTSNSSSSSNNAHNAAAPHNLGGAAAISTTGSTTSSHTPPLSQPMTPPPSASSITSNTSGIGSVTDSYDLHTDSEQVKYLGDHQDEI